MTSERAADAAALLDGAHIIPAHHQGWSLYTEPADHLVQAFHDAGLSDRLNTAPLGTWAI